MKLENVIQNILFLKESFECFGYISNYLPKLNGGLELVFGTQFLHIFPCKISFCSTLLNDQVLTFFTSQDIAKFVFLNSQTHAFSWWNV